MELLPAELSCLARCVCVRSLAVLASDPWQREADWPDRSADIAHDVLFFLLLFSSPDSPESPRLPDVQAGFRLGSSRQPPPFSLTPKFPILFFFQLAFVSSCCQAGFERQVVFAPVAQISAGTDTRKVAQNLGHEPRGAVVIRAHAEKLHNCNKI